MKTKTTFIHVIIIGFFVTIALSGCSKKNWNASLIEKKPIYEGAEYREVMFSSRQEKHSFRAYSVKLNANHYKVAIADNNDPKLYPLIDKIAKDNKAAIAINGGYFKSGFIPDGLYILKGKTLSSLNNNPVLSGILSVDREGFIELLPLSSKPIQSVYAIQAGPFLVDPGGKMGIKTDKESTRRTVIALSKNQELLLIATSETSLFKLADCLVSHPEIFGVSGIDRALNLDGGPSTALFVNLGEKPVIIQEQGPIRNVLLFWVR